MRLVRIVHSAIQGRGRYNVYGLRHSEALKVYLETELVTMDGVTHVVTSTLTANLLVLFDPHYTHAEIALAIERALLNFRKHGNTVRTHRQIHPPTAEPGMGAWHCLDAKSVSLALQTSESTGLCREMVTARLQKYGANALPAPAPHSRLQMFLAQFTSLPVLLLGGAAALSLFTGGLTDAIVILAVVAINGVIGYVTENQSEKTFQALKRFIRPTAFVCRDGTVLPVRGEEIVVGDVLLLAPGSYVAADARLMKAQHLSVDESALTGESMPVVKSTGAIDDEYCPLSARINMVYQGTFVTGGQGLGIVVATGRFTEMGRIHTLLGEAQAPETPMERQLQRMGNQLVVISSAVCALVFGIGFLRGYGLLAMLKSAISLAVAAVPEGLPTVATTTLALGIHTMQRHGVLIRQLDAVEALGSIQTICLDKTGTLTLNRMSVVSVHVDMQHLHMADGVFRNQESEFDPWTHAEFMRLLSVMVLCNESEVEVQESGFTLRGTATENALLHLALSADVDVAQLREHNPRLQMNHRAENRNFMTTLHKTQEGGFLVACKGSPTEVLAMCDWYARDGRVMPLTEEDRLSIEIANEHMAGNALRVLGVAYREDDQVEDMMAHPEKDLIWLGLVGMADPIRPGVKDLISVLHEAGIDTVMITGDQSPTAYAVAKELQLSRNEQIEIFDSTHLTDLAPELMTGLSKHVDVFARVSPAHKLQIVQALQRSGKVVAMTGDGVNDSPALKVAEVGIAMGYGGTDVAREVADVIIEDDNLETLVVAVSHGRTVYANIRKAVHFLLATNLSEIMVMFTSLAIGLGQPLSAMQLLWINLLSDVFPGLALALEAPEPDVMRQPPRPPDVPIIEPADLKRIAFESATLSAGAFGAYGYGLLRYGMGARANTLAFTSLTAGQLLHAISCRSETHSVFEPEKLPPNRYLTIALGGSLALQMLAFVIPGLRNLLGVTPLTVLDSVVVGGGALLPLLISETTKTRTRDQSV